MANPLLGVEEDEPRPLRYSFWKGAIILSGSVTPRVILDVLLFGVLTLVIVLASIAAETWFGLHVAVSVGPFAAAGSVLGLLLVLRTNAGYDRWWEARKLWGGIVNQSRGLATAGLAYGPKDVDWRSRFVRWVATFPHVVRRSLRGEKTMPEVERLLGPADTVHVIAAHHMPGYVAERIGMLIREASEAGLKDPAFMQMEGQRCGLVDHLGGCERILKTPLARSSAIQVRRFILLFLVSLPFGLMANFHDDVLTVHLLGITIPTRVWLVPMFTMLMAYPLLSLDRIGMELQNPFDKRRLDHLPLDGICTTIEHNLLELLVDEQPTTPEEVAGMVSMPQRPHRSPTDTHIS